MLVCIPSIQVLGIAGRIILWKFIISNLYFYPYSLLIACAPVVLKQETFSPRNHDGGSFY
jgi:hypothetical protein